MNIKARQNGSATVLELGGRFDAHDAPAAAAALEKAIAVTPQRVVVSLESVSFMDSTALAILVQGMKRRRQAGGDLYLCGLQQPVRMIFELTRLDKAVDIYTNEAEALR